MKTKNDSVEEKKTSTPDVKPYSNSIRIVIFIVIALVIVLYLKNTITNNSNNSTKSPNKTENTHQSVHDGNYTTLNLIDVNYSKYLTYTLQGGQKVKILLTNDYCPVWTSTSINMYQDDDSKRVICGTKIIQGPPSTYSQNYLFENTTDKPIVIKVGRNKIKVETFNFN